MNGSYFLPKFLAISGSIGYGIYYFGRNIMWKVDLQESNKEIKEHQTKIFKLLAEKIDLGDQKVQLEIKEAKINLETQIKNTKEEIIKEIKSGK